jgi:hypothetical protein
MGYEARDGRFIGQIGMSMAVEALLRAGFYVSIPIVDDGYDLLAADGRRYWRIQVKATAARGTNGRRCRIQRGSSKKTAYDPQHVDAFILVHVRTRCIVCVPVSETEGYSWYAFSVAKRKWSGVESLRRIKPLKQ